MLFLSHLKKKKTEYNNSLLHHIQQHPKKQNMYKRITYKSQINPDYTTSSDIEQLVQSIWSEKNRQRGVNGVILVVNDSLIQSLEGVSSSVDPLFQKIKSDSLHSDLICLQVEAHLDRSDLLFEGFPMKMLSISDEKTQHLLQRLLNSHQTLQRFSNPVIVDTMNSGLDPVKLPIQQTSKVFMCCSLINFEDLAHSLSPNSIGMLLDAFYNMVVRVVKQHEGTIIKYIEGGLVASFTGGCRAHNAVDAAFQLLKDAADYKSRCDNSQNRLYKLIYPSVGISSGYVLEGCIGTSKHMDHLIWGDAIKTATWLSTSLNGKYYVSFDENVVHIITADSVYYGKSKYVEEATIPDTDIQASVFSITIETNKRKSDLNEFMSEELETQQNSTEDFIRRGRSNSLKNSLRLSSELRGIETLSSSPTLSLLRAKTEEIEQLKREIAVYRTKMAELEHYEEKKRKRTMSGILHAIRKNPSSPHQASPKSSRPNSEN